MLGDRLNRLVETIHQSLLPGLRVASMTPHNPVVVQQLPSPWQVLGAGNYAAVMAHPEFPEQVVKVYAPGRPGHREEVEVYRRLGIHPAYSQCLFAGDHFLVLRRLRGVTLYDCLHRGLTIPIQVIRDVDAALDYAQERGLHPHDVHGRNVMMNNRRGLVVDVSDFLDQEPCNAWRDLRRAYFWVYRPIILPLRLKAPYWLLDWVRAAYRKVRRWRRVR